MVRRRLPATLFVSLLVVGMVAAPAAADDDEFEFVMHDRFAFETPTGASGSGEVEVDDGSVEIQVEAEGLLPNHPYELKVTIQVVTNGPPGAPSGFGFNPDNIHTFPATSDDDGEIEFEEDLVLAPGKWRLDFFVTHTDHPVAGVGSFPGLTAALGRDPLLSCAPAAIVTISADDDD